MTPEVERVLSSPLDARVLRLLQRPGAHLKRGDPVVELDVSESELALDKVVKDLKIKENQQAQSRLALEKSLVDLDGRLEVKTLQLQSAQSQLEGDQQLFKDGLFSRESLRRSELNVKQAQIELAQLREERTNAERSTGVQLEGLSLERGALDKEAAQARRLLDLSTTKSDRDGVLTWVVSQEGALVRRGDVIARIADLTSFRVDGTVSDIHAGRLRTGMAAVVRVNDVDLQGTVTEVLPTVENGVLHFTVALAEPSHAALRPSLRTDVLVVTERKARALRLKRGPFADNAARAGLRRPRRPRRPRPDPARPDRGRRCGGRVGSERGGRSDHLGHEGLPAPGGSPDQIAAQARNKAAAMIQLQQHRKGLPHRSHRDRRARRRQPVRGRRRVHLDHGAVRLRQEHAAQPDGAARRRRPRARCRSTARRSPAIAIATLAAIRNKEIGFVFQTFHLVSDLSVLDNVQIPLLYRRMSNGERRKLAEAALDRVGLSARIHHFPSQLSGGQQQRVAIARAIVGRPRILLADEPTGNLDSQMGDEVMGILKGLNGEDKTTIVMVTHDQQKADQTERIVRLFDGRQVN